MLALAMNGYGDPNVLKPIELPVPTPAQGQVLIRVRAAAINPADLKWRSGMFASFAPLVFPAVLGYDVAGTVIAGSRYSPGERIAGMLNPQVMGAYAEYAVLDEQACSQIPANLGYAEAAAVPTAGLTGLQVVREAAGVGPNETVLVTGALGAVGRAALYFSKLAGARVVAAVRANACNDALAHGADEVIALGADEWTGPSFNHIIDTVGGAEVARLARHVEKGGRIVTVATTPIPSDKLPVEPVFHAVRPSGTQLGELLAAVARGNLHLSVARTLPLLDAPLGHVLVEEGGQRGKIVLISDE